MQYKNCPNFSSKLIETLLSRPSEVDTILFIEGINGNIYAHNSLY